MSSKHNFKEGKRYNSSGIKMFPRLRERPPISRQQSSGGGFLAYEVRVVFHPPDADIVGYALIEGDREGILTEKVAKHYGVSQDQVLLSLMKENESVLFGINTSPAMIFVG